MEHEVQQDMYEAYTSGIEQQLGVKRTEISLCKLWSETAPEEFREIPLPDYLRKVSFLILILNAIDPIQTGWMINMWWGYHNYEEYRQLHEKKFDKPPYLSPCQKWKWQVFCWLLKYIVTDGRGRCDGASVTLEQRTAAEKEITVFKTWVSKHIIKADGSSIMIPSGSTNPDYRDEGSPNPTYADSKVIWSCPQCAQADIDCSGGGKPGGSYNWIFFATIQGLPHIISPSTFLNDASPNLCLLLRYISRPTPL